LSQEITASKVFITEKLA